MGHSPFTWFNIVTAHVLALTILFLWRSLRGARVSIWRLLYYAILAAYTIAFSGSLSPYFVAGGAACAIAMRLGFYPKLLIWPQTLALVYVVWRCVALIAMW